jgi:hypothetical protein
MSELPSRSVIEKTRTRVVAVLAIVVPIVVVLANGERAFDETSAVWLRWTTRAPVLETIWQGSWKSKGGFTFDFAMQLDVAGDDTATGQINWQLVGAPAESPLASHIGSKETEFVSGRYDRINGIASIAGYAVSDPTLLALDDKVSFVGMTGTAAIGKPKRAVR